ncbi:MAG: glycerate kinase [Bacteroidales bacterium]|nr:glycerate kinase [Bacteroidales bacterium]
MKIIAAFDSFKGCLSSPEAAAAVRRAAEDTLPGAEVVEVAVADGGEGTLEALVGSLGGRYMTATVSDPLGRPTVARYGIAGSLGIIEASRACGITLLKEEERNPLLTTTRGVGELILDAIANGCERFLVGIGGSATNDGGRGMIEAEGFLEKARRCNFTVACDVDTPFIGPFGASRVFAPQKGASPAEVEILDRRLTDYAKVILSETGVDVRDMPGAGAAGGLGGAFAAYLGAELRPGVEMVLEAIGFGTLLEGADLVLTGEGCSDVQTARGKAPAGVLAHARKKGVPVALVSGAVKHCPELDAMGFAAIIPATPESMPLEEAMKPEMAKENIYRAVRSLLKAYA